MNQRKSISVIISVILFVILIAACGTDGKPYAKDTVLKNISGVWKNFQYTGSAIPAKRINQPDGTITVYDSYESMTPTQTGKITIRKAWTDSSGILWFKSVVIFEASDVVSYELCRLKNDNEQLDILFTTDRFPKEWDPLRYPGCFYYHISD
jgi:hypothetical protein